jgi:hypothetical protein
MASLNDKVISELRPAGAVRLDVRSGEGATWMALGLHAGLVYALRREGYDVTVPGEPYEVFGPDYSIDRSTPAAQVLGLRVDVPPPDEGRVIHRVRIAELPDPGDLFAPEIAPIRDVSVTLRR